MKRSHATERKERKLHLAKDFSLRALHLQKNRIREEGALGLASAVSKEETATLVYCWEGLCNPSQKLNLRIPIRPPTPTSDDFPSDSGLEK